MIAMRLEKLRQVDLNVLITFAAIAEEKSVTAAASRLSLSQPAVSRALQRARALFQDDLLVRSPNGFELTLRGRKILDQLERLLPRMEHLVAPTAFDPVREKSNFRISGPDNVCTVVLPSLCRQYRLNNTWRQTTSLFQLMPGCRPFRTSNWRLLAQNAIRVYECLTLASPCNAS
jgi:DNA-binding transcriptional LysR family regulator